MGLISAHRSTAPPAGQATLLNTPDHARFLCDIALGGTCWDRAAARTHGPGTADANVRACPLRFAGPLGGAPT
jgi:hypothetical protein